VLKKHGIDNTVMTGDPAWYDPDRLGEPLHRPERIEKLVFTPPLSAFYGDQAAALLDMLTRMFPDAERFCAMHLTDKSVTPNARESNDAALRPEVAEKNAFVRRHAQKRGFEVVEFEGDINKMALYGESDLHVGYECHAHLGFFRQRRPSVLIAEDARGVGFNYTLGMPAFNSFGRPAGEATDPSSPPPEGGTSGYCVTEEEYRTAPANPHLIEDVEQFLREELSNGFRREVGVMRFIDETYEKRMKPSLKSLPGAS